MKKKLLKNKKVLIGISVLLVVSSLGMTVLTQDKDIKTIIREREYFAQKGNITVGVESSGQINTLPNQHTFEDNTVIDKLFVKLGSEVKKGDELASISTENLEALMTLAKDELSDAKAALLQATSQKNVLIKQNDKNKQDGLRGVHQDFEAKLSQHKSEEERILKSINELEDTIKNLEKQISELAVGVKDEEEKIANIQSEINENMLKIGEFNEKLLKVDDGSNERVLYNQKINNIQSEMNGLNKQLSEKIEAAKNNLSAITDLNEAIIAKTNRIGELESLINQSEDDAEKEQYTAEIQSLQDEINTLELNIKNLSYSTEISSINIRISSAEERLRNAQNDLLNVSNGSEKANAIRLEITIVQNENTALQLEIDKVMKDPIVSEFEKLKAKIEIKTSELVEKYTSYALKLEEIQQVEIQYEQSLTGQEADNNFADYKLNEELKAIQESIAKASRNVSRSIEKLDKIYELQKNPILYAQMDGIVTSLGYKVGDVVTSSKPVCVIGQLSETSLTVPVSASDIGKIRVGQKVNVYIDAFAEQRFTGIVTERLLVANDNGDYPVIITMDPTDQMLLPGMKAFSTIILKEKEDILTISNKAIILEDGEQYVNIRNEKGALVKRKIVTGFSDGRVSEVIEGLAENDIAVVQE
ncbi:MAG: HlyD family efflux transporter periplasmic adaptor subunit [Clostridia bacterium]|nr:HlyD family efflux transporter periplasmic adaptor subunit [Clostridia bacterium]